ncbi:MAG: NAD(P)-dependent oxidoreductase, partial [Alphaproteobacteria bacterium]|nr:NAD(P)-dependent oxidoreductase [Alphaproteobacteria bacterium]
LSRRLRDGGSAVAIVARPNSTLDQLGDAAGRLEVLRHDGSTAQLNGFVAEFSPAVVYHLAANFVGVHTSDDVAPLVADNVGFTAQLCEAMAAAGSPCLVAAGTVWQHAKSPPGEPVPTPNSLYAATKQAAEDIIAFYAGTGALSSIALKIYDSYGPGDPRPKLLNALAAKAAARETLDATSGKQKLHMVHVDDIVDAFCHAGTMLTSGQATGHHSYTLPSAEAVTLKSLVATWQKATGCTVDVAWGARAERPGEVMVPWESMALPGWEPKISLNAGFKTLFDA